MNKCLLTITVSALSLAYSNFAVADPLDTSHIHTQHTLGLKPISSLADSFNLAAATFLPDAEDGFGFGGNTLDDNVANRNSCTGFPLSSCPAHAKCSKCTFGSKYKITGCETDYKQSGNACVAKTCSEINAAYKAEVPANQVCAITKTSVRSCYSSCKNIDFSGYPLDSCPSGAVCTPHPDCGTTAAAKGNCSPLKQKVTGCTSSAQKVNSTATACIDKDDTCPATYYKSCDTGTQGTPKYTEKGSACYQCKPKEPELSCDSANYPDADCSATKGTILRTCEAPQANGSTMTFCKYSSCKSPYIYSSTQGYIGYGSERCLCPDSEFPATYCDNSVGTIKKSCSDSYHNANSRGHYKTDKTFCAYSSCNYPYKLENSTCTCPDNFYYYNAYIGGYRLSDRCADSISCYTDSSAYESCKRCNDSADILLNGACISRSTVCSAGQSCSVGQTYFIGNTPVGVVIKTDSSGRHGKIMALFDIDADGQEDSAVYNERTAKFPNTWAEKRSYVQVPFGKAVGDPVGTNPVTAAVTIAANSDNSPAVKDFDAKAFTLMLASDGFRAAAAAQRFSPKGCTESWCRAGNWYLPSYTDIEKAQTTGIGGSSMAISWTTDTYWTAAVKSSSMVWTYSYFSSGAVRYTYNLWSGGSGSSGGDPEVVHTRPIADF